MTEVTREDLDRVWDRFDERIELLRQNISHELAETRKEFGSQAKVLTQLVTRFAAAEQPGTGESCLRHDMSLTKIEGRVHTLELWRAELRGVHIGISMASAAGASVFTLLLQWLVGRIQ